MGETEIECLTHRQSEQKLRLGLKEEENWFKNSRRMWWALEFKKKKEEKLKMKAYYRYGLLNECGMEISTNK